jgi:cell division septation protein DedD
MNLKKLPPPSCAAFLVVILTLAGCETVTETVVVETETIVERPLLPLTTTLIGYMGEDSLTGYQYYISNQVVLLRENSGFRVRNAGGALELTNDYTGEQITIEGTTPGVIVKSGYEGGSIRTLETSFESGADNLTLRFVLSPEGSFDLETHDGMVRYGDGFYRLISAEKPVKLLVSLITGGGSPRPKTRTAPGRLVGETASLKTTPKEETVSDETLIPEGVTIDTMLDMMLEGESEAYIPVNEVPLARVPLPEPVETAKAPPPLEVPSPVYEPPSVWVPLPKPVEKANVSSPVFEEKPLAPPPVLSEPFIDPGVAVGELSYIALPSLAKGPDTAGENYWIQVGAFKKDDNAKRAYDRLSAAGFSPAYERRNGYSRILILDVSPEDLNGVKRRLASAGFRETLVRKEF